MKDIVVFDLDGTLADCSHRLHHILKEPKDWDAFFKECDKDAPITYMIDFFHTLSCHYTTYIVTGRSEVAKQQTETWLLDKRCFPDRLIMRQEGDHTDDHILKLKMVEDFKDRIAFVFEDRTRVVKMWRDAGIPCFQVADGDF
jgi:phosphoglycolate phosphatase-like HAD superfamily hydrolase